MKYYSLIVLAGMLSAAPAHADDTISVIPLDNVSVDTIGTMYVNQNGLPTDFWKNVSRKEAERYLATLPSSFDSPILSSLVNRMVLSVVEPPEGEGLYDSLILLRLDVLYNQADYGSFSSFYQTIPQDSITEEMQLKYMLRSLYQAAPDYQEVCQKNSANEAIYRDQTLRLAKVFCQAALGESEKALLSLSLIQEDYPALPYHTFQLFTQLIHADENTTPASVILPSPLLPLDLLSVIKLGVPIPEGIELDAYPVFMLNAIAHYDKTPKVLRLRAAEKSFKNGHMKPEGLASVYNSIDFPEEMLAKAGVDSLDLPPSLLRALLYQVLEKAGDDKVYPAMHALLAQYRKDNMLNVAYDLLGADKRIQLQEAQQPNATLLSLAPDIIKIALYHSADKNIPLAKKWYKLLEKQTLTSAKNTESKVYLSYLIEIAAIEEDPKIAEENTLPWQRIYDQSSPKLTAWWESQSKNDQLKNDISDPALLSAMIVITDALGFDVPNEIKQYHAELLAEKRHLTVYNIAHTQEMLFDRGEENNASIARQLYTVLKAFEYAPLKSMSPVVMAAAIQQLQRIGLYDDAKLLALHYMLQR